MVKPKVQSKKQQKRGVDFKKIKRKVGRKLPPANNATNTEIKSKAIVLPEQSVASEKAGLAVSKKGLTLKELLQQTSHHNVKVRKDALAGIKDIFLRYPTELKLHKLAVIEKLRERISDDDKVVREALYQLFKSVIFPACKEDNKGPFISMMMAYIFNGMTHLAVEVRLMAFKFLDIVIQHYPSSFSTHAEKILQNYQDVLQKNKFYLQDKGKLKSAVAGLVHCLSLLPCKSEDDTSVANENDATEILHAYEPVISNDLKGLLGISDKLKDLLPILVNCLQDFMPLVQSMPSLDSQSYDCMLYILESIDLIVRFSIFGMSRSQQNLQSLLHPHEGPKMITYDQIISSRTLKKLWDAFPLIPAQHFSEKDDDRYFVLNIMLTEIFLHLSDWNCPPPDPFEKFLEFIESSLSDKTCSGRQLGKVFREKHLLRLIPFISKLTLRISGHWKSRILQAFTQVFQNCNPESSMKLACIAAIEEMLLPEHGWLYPDACEPELLSYHMTWMRELPSLLMLLGDKHPSSSRAVLGLQLRLGQVAQLSLLLLKEYDSMQYILKDFYDGCLDERSSGCCPFMKLARDIQELALCCLYYFSCLDPLLLQSLASCCLCRDLDPCLLVRVLEVLQSAYRVGHIQIADYLSFLVTLLSRLQIYPGKVQPMKHDGKSNRGTFKSIASFICSDLSQIGDGYLVFQILENIVIDQMTLKLPVENMCAVLRVLVALDSKPTRLSDQSIIKLSQILPEYLICTVSNAPENEESDATLSTMGDHYYLLPCYFLFHQSNRLLRLMLDAMASLISEKGSTLICRDHTSSTGHSSRLKALVSVLLLMHKDNKIRQILLLCKTEIDRIRQNLIVLETSEELNMTIEERHTIQWASGRLRDLIMGD